MIKKLYADLPKGVCIKGHQFMAKENYSGRSRSTERVAGSRNPRQRMDCTRRRYFPYQGAGELCYKFFIGLFRFFQQ